MGWFNDHLSTIFLELPVPVVQGTDLSRSQPSRNAVEMKGVLTDELASYVNKTEKLEGAIYIADTPGYGAFFCCSGTLIRLAFDAYRPSLLESCAYHHISHSIKTYTSP